MAESNSPISRLISAFSSLPSIGKKSAERLAYHVLKMPNEEAIESVEMADLTATVSVEWDRNSSYEGLPTVNGVSVTKTGKTGNTYTGTANISGEYTKTM